MFTHIQNSFAAGELSPSIFSRNDLQKWHSGASTMRNFFVNYRGGAASRAGYVYVGMCKQGAPNFGGTVTDNPPRDIPFQFNITQGYALEFGDQYMRIKVDGAYVVETGKNIVSITQANPGVVGIVAHGFSNNDWIYGSGIGGMTELNGLTWIVQNATANTFTLTDLFGNIVDTTLYGAYTTGGKFSRIYTLATPYAAIDLPFLKYTQSADTMSLTCVNQDTGTEYPPYDLQRQGAALWVLTQASFATIIDAPTNLTAVANNSTTVDTWYGYTVTAVTKDGEESIAADPVQIENNNISLFAGSNTITWSAVADAVSYRIYAATSRYNAQVPVGVLYGFVGNSIGTNFIDTNTLPDFTRVPPTHQDPFARGQIIGVNVTAPGAGYVQSTTGYTITTSTGSGAVLEPIVSDAGLIVGFLVQSSGKGYANTDTITVTSSGVGSGATATLDIGPQAGTYPGAVAYFQQRRYYANTQNNPDTYFASQPGAFLNMDSSDPTVDNDAIVGSPWAQQINGIQFMVPMPGGLVILTGNGAWQLTGGTNAAVTPSSQDATPQAYNGCNSHIQPIVANYDILYVQSKGSIVRDLAYNFFVNIYTGTDTTVLSNHLFNNHQLVQWCYAEEPYKIIWAIRDDGILLSFTYLKEQDVYAWARHDTNGFFKSAVSISEPPSGASKVFVDAVYVITQRYVQNHWVYYSERMNDRNWNAVEDCWCVDAGLAYGMREPAATLTPASATGTNSITSVNLIFGGSNYTNPVIIAVDPLNAGSGATFSAALSGGVIVGITPVNPGQGYVAGTQLRIVDLTGTGAKASPIITNNVVFKTSSGVFSATDIGNVIRAGGGKATITSYQSTTQVTANITQPITSIIPNNPELMPVPQSAGQWTLSTPVTHISGLNHLNGMKVSILADGSVLPQQTVVNNGINLPAPYSQITVGLPFTAQLQTMYLDPPGPDTSQGKRKNIQGVTVRVEASRGMAVGVNQPDASTQPNGAPIPWSGLYPFKERSASVHAGSAIPLFTGDEYIPVSSDWNELSQVAIQQSDPLPANVGAVISWFSQGDSSG